MWEGVTVVQPGYDPILSETPDTTTVILMNAGPGFITVRAWDDRHPESTRPDIEMEMRPGDTRIVSGQLVRAHIIIDENSGCHSAPKQNFSCVGWRIRSSIGVLYVP